MGPSPILRFCFLHPSARRLKLEVDDIQKVLMSSSQVEKAVRLVQDRKQEKRKPPVKREIENREVVIRNKLACDGAIASTAHDPPTLLLTTTTTLVFRRRAQSSDPPANLLCSEVLSGSSPYIMNGTAVPIPLGSALAKCELESIQFPPQTLASPYPSSESTWLDAQAFK
jgi:hypothetical protein